MPIVTRGALFVKRFDEIGEKYRDGKSDVHNGISRAPSHSVLLWVLQLCLRQSGPMIPIWERGGEETETGIYR